jgi:hypothetical protein
MSDEIEISARQLALENYISMCKLDMFPAHNSFLRAMSNVFTAVIEVSVSFRLPSSALMKMCHTGCCMHVAECQRNFNFLPIN